MLYHLDFSTSYSQFYICDKDFEGDLGSDKFWTKEAFDDRLAIEDGILGIGTECYGPVKGEFEILIASNDNVALNKYDHIVEAGIEIKSGVIQILDCPFSNVELQVIIERGAYRARIYSSNLNSVDGDEGDDYYRIEIWPDTDMERKVIKRYDR
jgi:hypothetical protein